MEKGLYERLMENPLLVETLENNFRGKLARGGSVKLSPLNIIRLPKPEVLREKMHERYGIENIDSYYIPVILDSESYRKIKGENKPSIFEGYEEFSRKWGMTEGHVKNQPLKWLV